MITWNIFSSAPGGGFNNTEQSMGGVISPNQILETGIKDCMQGFFVVVFLNVSIDCYLFFFTSLRPTAPVRLLVVVDIRLEEVFGDEVVLHAVALLVPLGPRRV